LAAPVFRYAAFTDDPAGGNPAGVVLDASDMSVEEMQAVAAEVGYSETAFLTPEAAAGEYTVRYYSPLAEVPFCGHATIAAGVAVAQRGSRGELLFQTRSGPVAVKTATDGDGHETATLTSVPAGVVDLKAADLDDLLAALGWSPDDLDPSLPPRVGYGGAYHPILAAATRARLAALDYDFERLKRLMTDRDWTTIQLVWREEELLFHARDPFPVGGVVEDPATGAAAAALGGYLRSLGLVAPPATVTVLQGEDLGRPGRLTVHIPADRPSIDVTGTAVQI
jgi:PhzF family phenazine biosynthesis protein